MGSKALYLPSETHTWLNTNNEPFINRKLQEVLAVSRKSEFDLLLPLHMNGSHWGLVVIDLLGRQLLFDDGYKLKPATGVLTTIKRILDVFHQLFPGSLCLSNFFSTSANAIERFGMPSQHDCGVSGKGTWSCGAGVILAARDFIFKGVDGTIVSLNGNIQK